MAQTVNLEKTRFLSPPPKSPETGFFAKSTAQTVNLEKTRFLSPPPESPLSFPERSRRVEGSKWTFRLRSMSKAPWRLLYQTANLEKTRFLSPPPESPETGFFAKSTAQTPNLEKTRFLSPPPESPETGFFAKSMAQTANLEKTRFLHPANNSQFTYPKEQTNDKSTTRKKRMASPSWRFVQSRIHAYSI